MAYRPKYKTKEYKKLKEVWTNMMNRCYRKTTPGYERYGGRGIEVCDSWRSFTNFYNDMLPLYKEGLSIERINNDIGYSPENCTFATWREQCLNRKSNRVINYKGVSKTLGEWAEYLGIGRTTISQRIDSYGWGIEKALSTEVLH